MTKQESQHLVQIRSTKGKTKKIIKVYKYEYYKVDLITMIEMKFELKYLDFEPNNSKCLCFSYDCAFD